MCARVCVCVCVRACVRARSRACWGELVRSVVRLGVEAMFVRERD